MTTPLLLENARVLTPSEQLNQPVLIVDGKIAPPDGEPPPSAQRLNLSGHWLVPGFIDLHVHGGRGAQFTSGDVEECVQASRFHAEHGTTSLLATTVSAPPGQVLAAVKAIAQAADHDGTGATILGAHLEGPFLNSHRCGAQNPAYMRAPNTVELSRLIDAGDTRVKMVAVAPELPGALDFIAFAADRGLVPAIGHSDATYEQASAALDAGARHAIHLFNAMRPFQHREPGIIGAVLERPEVTCELIADGHHVHPAALGLATSLKGTSGAVLITDAVEAAGMPDGAYRLGEAEIRVVDGRAVLADRESLAGSTLTMSAAVRGAVDLVGLPLRDAITMATATPAVVIGLAHQIGRIAPGYDADLAVLDHDLEVRATIRGGDFVHGSPDEFAWARS